MAATLYRSHHQERGRVNMEIWGDTVEEIQAEYAKYEANYPKAGYCTYMTEPKVEAHSNGQLIARVGRYASCD